MMVERHSLERIVFGTLGFTNPSPGDKRPDPNKDFREAGRRLNSLRSHVLKDAFSEMIIVPERGAKSGRLHFHLVGAQEHDVRTGVDFVAIAAGDYRSAPEALRDLWKLFRDEKTGGKGTAAAYGFGRTEWLPVKSTTEGIARYVGKYIAKQFAGRRPEDKGIRLVRYTQGTNCWRARFSWNSPRAKLWRWQVGRFAAKYGCNDLDALSERFGPRWAYKKQEEIMGQPDIPTDPALLQVWFEDQVMMRKAGEFAGAPKQEIGSWILERGRRAAERWAHGPTLIRPLPETPEKDAEELDTTTIWADGRIEHEPALLAHMGT
jgi:hypothetical protein